MADSTGQRGTDGGLEAGAGAWSDEDDGIFTSDGADRTVATDLSLFDEAMLVDSILPSSTSPRPSELPAGGDIRLSARPPKVVKRPEQVPAAAPGALDDSEDDAPEGQPPRDERTSVLSADVLERSWAMAAAAPLPEPAARHAGGSERGSSAAARRPPGEEISASVKPKSLLAMSWLGDQVTWTSQAVVDHRYRLLDSLGRGGMGDVILAEDLFLRRKVALKTLRQNLENDQEALECFRQEVAMAHAVAHPGLARTFDLGEAGGVTFLTMEYLGGETLADRIKREGPLPVAEVRRIGLEVAAAMDAAHVAGIIHRDLKPSNIMLTPDRGAVVMDFGLAAAAESRPRQEAARLRGSRSDLMRPTSSSAGTPNYMAPEQWRGETQGVPTDLYAFGVILYEALTGELPFQADNRLAMMRAHLEDPAPSVRARRAEVPVSLDRLVASCLEKDPARRPPSMVQVARVLVVRNLRPALLSAGLALLVALAVLGSGAAVWQITRSLLLTQIQPAVRRLAEITAARLDPADLARVHTPADMEGESFQRAWTALDRIKRENPETRFAYTLRLKTPPSTWEFVVDADPRDRDQDGDGTIADEEKGSPPGMVYDGSAFPAMAGAYTSGRAQTDPGFKTDAWGISLSGYAPLTGPDGEVFLVGCDAGNEPLVRLRKSLFVIFSALGLLAAGVVVVTRRRRMVLLPGFSRERALVK